MGKQFTFEVSVQKDHKLITTFPYNIVRHPSYIAQFFVWIGMFTALASPDGWTRTFVWGYLVKNGGVAGALAAIVMGLVVLFYLAGFQMCVARTAHEDGLLRETFGKEWDEWAKNVPYRLVPGVY
jgi:protein-S-isoprenylcysteine O-methyltransferase Ste14